MLSLSRIVGIVNVTGDSFSEAGASAVADGAERACRLLASGADIVEFGAESTRPGAREVAPEEELARLRFALDKFAEKIPDGAFAVDTRNGLCAKEALKRGARYVGDVSMLRHDPSLAETVAAFPQAELVLCHSRGTPQDMKDKKYQDYGEDIVESVIEELSAAADKAVRAGVSAERIVYDPGFGFGKSVSQQMTMLREIGRFKKLGRIFAGVSRKSFLGAISGIEDPAERLIPSVVAELHLVGKGIDYLRTHEVEPLSRAWLLYRELHRC